MKFTFSKEWCRKNALLEGDTEVRVGSPEIQENESASDPLDFYAAARLAFGRFIQLMRRNNSLTAEQLADSADIDVEEIVSIEADLHYAPEPRTVYQLARAFSVPEKKLMQLAGLAHAQDPSFTEQAVRFAARSESLEKLNTEEKKALASFIALLSSKE